MESGKEDVSTRVGGGDTCGRWSGKSLGQRLKGNENKPHGSLEKHLSQELAVQRPGGREGRAGGSLLQEQEGGQCDGRR